MNPCVYKCFVGWKISNTKGLKWAKFDMMIMLAFVDVCIPYNWMQELKKELRSGIWLDFGTRLVLWVLFVISRSFRSRERSMVLLCLTWLCVCMFGSYACLLPSIMILDHTLSCCYIIVICWNYCMAYWKHIGCVYICWDGLYAGDRVGPGGYDDIELGCC